MNDENFDLDLQNDESEAFVVDFGEVINVGGGGGGTSDFNDLENRPSYAGQTMTGNTNIPAVPTKTSDLTNDSDYQTGTEVESAISTAVAGKQDTLTAGDNITIDGDTISATDTTYTAGANVSISDQNVISATDTTYSAGANVSISDQNVISATDTTYTAGNNVSISDQNVISATGTTYTAGNNVTISDQNVISATDTTYTAGNNVSISDQNVISATDTTYSNFTGTDGTAAGTAGLVPAPAITDAGKFLKADGTWDVAGGGGGGDTVYSTKTTSNDTDGGAVYIGPLNANQQELADPTITDYHYRYFWALPFDTSGLQNFGVPQSESINIGGKSTGQHSVSLGYRSVASDSNSVVVGFQSKSSGFGNNVVLGQSVNAQGSNEVLLGHGAEASVNGSVGLGAYSKPTRVGEVHIGSTSSPYGFNSTNYRVLGGVYDGQDAHDAATVGQINATIDAINTALSTNIPHIGASS